MKCSIKVDAMISKRMFFYNPLIYNANYIHDFLNFNLNLILITANALLNYHPIKELRSIRKNAETRERT